MKNRKRIIMLALAGVLAASAIFAGCGSGEKNSAEAASSAASSSSAEEDAEPEDELEIEEDDISSIPVSSEDLPLAECVRLADYKGMELTKNIYSITDEDVESYANSMNELNEVTGDDATVQEGDIVNLAFEGTIDGVAFDGGTSDDYDLEIGSDSFIDGFEDGMIGMKIGEERDLNLTFPEEYGNEELNGKDVVFHVKVNTISRYPELTDEEREEAKKSLAESNCQQSEDELIWNAWSELVDNSTFLNLRQSDVDKYHKELQESTEAQLAANEMTLAEYCEMYGMTEEEYQDEVLTRAKEQAKERLVIDAFMEAENLSTDDELYKENLAELVEQQGMTEEELIEQAGEDYLFEYLITKVIAQKIVETANVTEEQVESDAMLGLYD